MGQLQGVSEQQGVEEETMMVWWRFKLGTNPEWRFGYMTDAGNGLVRMGPWNGCENRGPVVERFEVETKPYKGSL